MSSTQTKKGRAPAVTHSKEDTIEVIASTSQLPPPTHSTRSKGKNVAHESEDSSVAPPTIPSGPRAVDEGTPAYSVVEDANDQLRSEGIQRPSNQLRNRHQNSPSPEEWAAAQREIAALKSANQKLRQPTTKKRGKQRYQSGANPGSRSDSGNYHQKDSRVLIGKPHFHQRPSGEPPGPPSGDSSDSDRSEYRPSRRRSRHRRRRHRSRSSSRYSSRYRFSRKIEDPDKLDNGVDPTYKQWKDLMDGKMYGNRDWWETEQDRMFYVFGRTQGDARNHLHARWGPESYDPFVDVADMFEFLKQIYINPNEVREAKDAYADLQQGLTPFPEFRVKFLQLAMQGHIPRSEFKDDLYRKLHPRVRELLSGNVRRLTYEELCEHALDVDVEVRASRKLAAAKKELKALPASKPQGQKARALIPGTFPLRPSLPPASERQRLATPPPDQKQRSYTAEKEDTCHNCGKTGHWAKECSEAPKHHIHEINELHPRVMEVDTDDEEAGEASQPENGDA
jgi:hypothetical protein